RPTASCRRTWCTCTAARPATSSARWTWTSPISPAGASGLSRSTTAVPAGMGETSRTRRRARGGWAASPPSRAGRPRPPGRGRGAARARAEQGRVDPARIAVRGGSAGGFTTAAALTSVDTFACGTAMFPVIDLLAFATGETHDFESRYLDGLIGPLPEEREVY